jgi:hypothetical protein
MTLRDRKRMMDEMMNAEDPKTKLPGDKGHTPTPPPAPAPKKKKGWW